MYINHLIVESHRMFIYNKLMTKGLLMKYYAKKCVLQDGNGKAGNLKTTTLLFGKTSVQMPVQKTLLSQKTNLSSLLLNLAYMKSKWHSFVKLNHQLTSALTAKQ